MGFKAEINYSDLLDMAKDYRKEGGKIDLEAISEEHIGSRMCFGAELIHPEVVDFEIEPDKLIKKLKKEHLNDMQILEVLLKYEDGDYECKYFETDDPRYCHDLVELKICGLILDFEV